MEASVCSVKAMDIISCLASGQGCRAKKPFVAGWVQFFLQGDSVLSHYIIPCCPWSHMCDICHIFCTCFGFPQKLNDTMCHNSTVAYYSTIAIPKSCARKEELTMVSKISQGGYGTVYRGVLETWLRRSVDFSQIVGGGSSSLQLTPRNRKLIGPEVLSRQGFRGWLLGFGLECNRESWEFKLNIKKGPETRMSGEIWQETYDICIS